MDEANLARRRSVSQLRQRRGRPSRLLEQLPHPAGLVGGDDDATARVGQFEQPRARAIRASGERWSGRVAGLALRLLLEPLRRSSDHCLEGCAGVVRERPFRREFASAHEPVLAVDGLRIEVDGQRAKLVEVGQDEMRCVRHVIGGRTRGEKCRPGLRRLADVPLRQTCGVLLQLVRGQWGPLPNVLPSAQRPELGRRHEVNLR